MQLGGRWAEGEWPRGTGACDELRGVREGGDHVRPSFTAKDIISALSAVGVIGGNVMCEIIHYPEWSWLCCAASSELTIFLGKESHHWWINILYQIIQGKKNAQLIVELQNQITIFHLQWNNGYGYWSPEDAKTSRENVGEQLQGGRPRCQHLNSLIHLSIIQSWSTSQVLLHY